MNRILTTSALVAFALALVSTTDAGEKKNPCIVPVPRDKGWMSRHEGFVAIAKKGDVDVLLLGDSITDAWRGKGAEPTFKKHFVALKTANFGIGGDRTEHVLWRIQNGELDGINPKVVMLMIGTNNSGSNSSEQIAEGVTAIVKEIHKQKPTTKILLLAVFPRSPKADNPIRAKLGKINEIISKLDDGKTVKYLDIGKKFLQDDGELTKEIMPDYLHLSQKGYEIWGDAVIPTIHAMLGRKE